MFEGEGKCIKSYGGDIWRKEIEVGIGGRIILNCTLKK